MAINDRDYCAGYDVPVTDRNLAYVARVRAAGRFLRARAYRRFLATVEANGGTFDSDGPQRTTWQLADFAAYRFEDRAMAHRRLCRDRQCRREQAERVRLIHAAPLRCMVPQHDVDGLALFDNARSPTLL